jgi:hypothetical protein
MRRKHVPLAARTRHDHLIAYVDPDSRKSRQRGSLLSGTASVTDSFQTPTTKERKQVSESKKSTAKKIVAKESGPRPR